jgi:hypothetical protein
LIEVKVNGSNFRIHWCSLMARETAMSEKYEGVREAVAVFDTEAALQGAIDELLIAGFGQADVSLLANEAAVTEKLGGSYRKVSELEDELGVPSAAYVSPEAIGDAEGAVIGALMYVGAGILMGPIALAGGGITSILGGAVIGGGVGGAIGTVLAMAIGIEHATHIEEQLDHGGLLLWVRIWDLDHQVRALEILTRHSGRDVHVHEFPTPS